MSCLLFCLLPSLLLSESDDIFLFLCNGVEELGGELRSKEMSGSKIDGRSEKLRRVSGGRASISALVFRLDARPAADSRLEWLPEAGRGVQLR